MTTDIATHKPIGRRSRAASPAAGNASEMAGPSGQIIPGHILLRGGRVGVRRGANRRSYP
jgi:hypothetical protein